MMESAEAKITNLAPERDMQDLQRQSILVARDACCLRISYGCQDVVCKIAVQATCIDRGNGDTHTAA